ncbi:MAG: fibrobacter succinogenes major paralogous domain-containing protein [Rikenella sp.]|nr:fibrobacter succinogenes major paralogous domain-containing protein [Rikenella sp.]
MFLVTIFSAIRNPGSFYLGGNIYQDWTTPQNDDLWQDAVKTLFDPCPSGWRVPRSGEDDQSPWRDFTLTNGSWIPSGGIQWSTPQIHSGQAWYACTGIRSASTGTMMITTIEAYYWTSSPFFEKAGTSSHLGFSKTFINVNKSGGRNYSLPIRCVRE